MRWIDENMGRIIIAVGATQLVTCGIGIYSIVQSHKNTMTAETVTCSMQSHGKNSCLNRPDVVTLIPKLQASASASQFQPTPR